MASTKNDAIISKANAHRIRKFGLIDWYVQTWSQKLLNNQCCKGLVFIDCMCNSGEYYDSDEQQVFGTTISVFKLLRDAAGQYTNRHIPLYFNNIEVDKVNHLKEFNNCKDKRNFHVRFSAEDGNELLKKLGQMINKNRDTHYLLIYDPYGVTIDWDAVCQFFNSWGEFITNHALMDSSCAVKIAQSEATLNRYETTYPMNIGGLSTYLGDRAAFEKRIEDIIVTLRRDKMEDYYIAVAPFFHRKNAIVYNLIHCAA